MYIKPKRLVNPYEERMLEFLQTCIDSNYRIHTQVSLSQICQVDSYIEPDLGKFLFSSSLDAVITDLNFMPCLAVEFQSSYHDSFEAQNRDRKKAELLSLAGVPLLYSRIKDFGLLYLYYKQDSVIFNLFTGEGRELAINLVKNYYQSSVNYQSVKLKVI